MIHTTQTHSPSPSRLECYVCNEFSSETQQLFTSETPFSHTPYPQCLGQLLGDKYAVVMQMDDQICESCSGILDERDKLYEDIKILEEKVLVYLKLKVTAFDDERSYLVTPKEAGACKKIVPKKTAGKQILDQQPPTVTSQSSEKSKNQTSKSPAVESKQQSISIQEKNIQRPMRDDCSTSNEELRPHKVIHYKPQLIKEQETDIHQFIKKHLKFQDTSEMSSNEIESRLEVQCPLGEIPEFNLLCHEDFELPELCDSIRIQDTEIQQLEKESSLLCELNEELEHQMRILDPNVQAPRESRQFLEPPPTKSQEGIVNSDLMKELDSLPLVEDDDIEIISEILSNSTCENTSEKNADSNKVIHYKPQPITSKEIPLIEDIEIISGKSKNTVKIIKLKTIKRLKKQPVNKDLKTPSTPSKSVPIRIQSKPTILKQKSSSKKAKVQLRTFTTLSQNKVLQNNSQLKKSDTGFSYLTTSSKPVKNQPINVRKLGSIAGVFKTKQQIRPTSGTAKCQLNVRPTKSSQLTLQPNVKPIKNPRKQQLIPKSAIPNLQLNSRSNIKPIKSSQRHLQPKIITPIKNPQQQITAIPNPQLNSGSYIRPIKISQLTSQSKTSPIKNIQQPTVFPITTTFNPQRNIKSIKNPQLNSNIKPIKNISQQATNAPITTILNPQVNPQSTKKSVKPHQSISQSKIKPINNPQPHTIIPINTILNPSSTIGQIQNLVPLTGIVNPQLNIGQITKITPITLNQLQEIAQIRQQSNISNLLLAPNNNNTNTRALHNILPKPISSSNYLYVPQKLQTHNASTARLPKTQFTKSNKKFLKKYCFNNECYVCNEQFESFALLLIHLRYKHVQETIECKHCKIKLKHTGPYVNHLMYHKTTNITCVLCGENNNNINTLKNHMALIHGCIFSCSECGQQFKTKLLLKNHINTHLGIDIVFESNITKEYICHKCKGWPIFNNEYQFKLHNMKLHRRAKRRTTRKDKNPSLCDLCGKMFSFKNTLKTHMSLHTGVYLYKCDICNRGFNSITCLNNHKETHKAVNEKIKAYICEYCGKQFSQQGVYSVHRRWHENPYPAECKYCGLKGRHLSLMKEHIRKEHTKEQPYQCNICELKFYTKRDLDRHRHKHGIYRLNCCDIGFGKKNTYDTHRFKVHGIPIPEKRYKVGENKMVIPDGPTFILPKKINQGSGKVQENPCKKT